MPSRCERLPSNGLLWRALLVVWAVGAPPFTTTFGMISEISFVATAPLCRSTPFVLKMWETKSVRVHHIDLLGEVRLRTAKVWHNSKAPTNASWSRKPTSLLLDL